MTWATPVEKIIWGEGHGTCTLNSPYRDSSSQCGIFVLLMNRHEFFTKTYTDFSSDFEVYQISLIYPIMIFEVKLRFF